MTVPSKLLINLNPWTFMCVSLRNRCVVYHSGMFETLNRLWFQLLLLHSELKKPPKEKHTEDLSLRL